MKPGLQNGGPCVEFSNDGAGAGMFRDEFAGGLQVVPITKLGLNPAKAFEPRTGAIGVADFDGIAQPFGGNAEGVELGGIGVEKRFDAGEQRAWRSLLQREFKRVAEFAREEFGELRGGEIALALEVVDDGIGGGPADKPEGDITVAHGGGAVADAAELFARLAITQSFGKPPDGDSQVVDGVLGGLLDSSLHLRE